jgi:putative transport protein
METLRTFLEQQSLLSMFLVIGLGYAIGAVDIRGFALGIGAARCRNATVSFFIS